MKTAVHTKVNGDMQCVTCRNSKNHKRLYYLAAHNPSEGLCAAK